MCLQCFCKTLNFLPLGTALVDKVVIQTCLWSMRMSLCFDGSAVNRGALAIVFVEGVVSSQAVWICWWFPAICFPPSTNCTGRAQARRAQDVLLERFSCPFLCPFGPQASRASGRAERRRSEDERVFRVKPFAEMQGRMTLSLNYSGLSKHRMKCWM